MQKKNASLILAGTLAASALGANAFANSEMESSSDSPSSYEQSQSGDSWEAKKAEMQKKSSEMRAKKVAELKEKGLDVSSITPELLDATKTDEGKFWDAVKKIMNAHEIEARRAFLEKLKAQGVDVSSITEDVIADGSKFWDAVKKLQKTGSGSMSGNGASLGGEIKEYLRADLTAEDMKALMATMEELGKSTKYVLDNKTLSVEEKVSKIVELHEANMETLIAKYVDPAKADAFREKSEKKLAEVAAYVKKALENGKNLPSKYDDRKPQEQERKKNVPKEREDKKPPVIMQKANPLSPKLRKSLETKLRAIPDDKKDEFYQRAKTVLAAQIEKAKEANKPKLVAKLEAVMAIVEDVIGPADSEDSAIIDAIFNSGSTAQ